MVFFKMGKGFVPCLCFVFVLLNSSFSEAREYLLGGRENLWKIPSKPDGLIHWASKMRFLVGDSIEIKYDPKADSVLHITEQNYNACNTSNPIKADGSGDTKIVFDHSGPYYFISGAEGHCEKGEKMMVWVLSAKHSIRGHDHVAAPATTSAVSPAKLPTPVRALLSFHAPAPAPSSGVTMRGGALVVTFVFVNMIGLVLG